MPITYIPLHVLVKADGFGYKLAYKEVEFDATAVGSQDLFEVTGDVIVRVIGAVDTSLTSAAGGSLAVGCDGQTDIIGGYTLATDLDADEIWRNDTPDSFIEDLSVMTEKIIIGGTDIILYYDDTIDTGVLKFYCFWTPLSAGATVIAAP